MPETTAPLKTGTGPGRTITAVYGVLALAATGRSTMQLLTAFDRAPLAYLLSGFAAVVYLVATVALARNRWQIAWVAVLIELVGVATVGLTSYLAPSHFPDKTVWSHFGSGYGFVPLVLPFVGLWWLRKTRPAGT